MKNVFKLMILLPLVGLFGRSYSLTDATELDLKEESLRAEVRRKRAESLTGGGHCRTVKKLVEFLVDNNRPMNPSGGPMTGEEVGFFLNMVQSWPMNMEYMGVGDDKFMLGMTILSNEEELRWKRDTYERCKSNASNTEEDAAKCGQLSKEIDSIEQGIVMDREKYKQVCEERNAEALSENLAQTTK